MKYTAEDFQRDMNVSRETLEQFFQYEALLRKWQNSVNLVSKRTLDDVWKRHFLDSAQLAQYIPHKKSRIVDLGSGAGLPALVLSILGCNVTMVESDTKKCLFLKDVIRNLSLSARVENTRIEMADISADILTARALAPLKDLLFYSDNILKDEGRCLFLKGRLTEDEIRDAYTDGWEFKVNMHDSLSSDDSYVLEITDIKNVSRETL